MLLPHIVPWIWSDIYLQGLCEWRDTIARAEDESTGYVLPNKILLEIGKYTCWKQALIFY